MYTRVFQKRHFKKNKTSTPARNWGVPRKFISRRKCWSHKSRGLEKWLKVWQNRRRRRDDRNALTMASRSRRRRDRYGFLLEWSWNCTFFQNRRWGDRDRGPVAEGGESKGRRNSFEDGRGSLGRSWSKMANFNNHELSIALRGILKIWTLMCLGRGWPRFPPEWWERFFCQSNVIAFLT